MRQLTFRISNGQEYTISVKEENDEYWWTDGNMSCDCNRLLEIERSYPEVDIDNLRCGDTIKLIKVDPAWDDEESIWD